MKKNAIILLCKKPNKNEYRNLKIGNSYPITAGNDMDPNLLKDEDFAKYKEQLANMKAVDDNLTDESIEQEYLSRRVSFEI